MRRDGDAANEESPFREPGWFSVHGVLWSAQVLIDVIFELLCDGEVRMLKMRCKTECTIDHALQPDRVNEEGTYAFPWQALGVWDLRRHKWQS